MICIVGDQELLNEPCKNSSLKCLCAWLANAKKALLQSYKTLVTSAWSQINASVIIQTNAQCRLRTIKNEVKKQYFWGLSSKLNHILLFNLYNYRASLLWERFQKQGYRLSGFPWIFSILNCQLGGISGVWTFVNSTAHALRHCECAGCTESMQCVLCIHNIPDVLRSSRQSAGCPNFEDYSKEEQSQTSKLYLLYNCWLVLWVSTYLKMRMSKWNATPLFSFGHHELLRRSEQRAQLE